MYIPAAFRVDNPAKLAAFIRQYSFATLITHDDQAPFASHVPMLLRPEGGPHGTLFAHVARANPQWQHFASGQEALAIFHGPHTYISPSWYQTEPAVPTWNYATVHAYGVPTVFEDPEKAATLLRETIALYEASYERRWPGILPEDYFAKMLRGIVAFEMPIMRLEGKFKLGQNRAEADVQSVFSTLSQAPDADSRALAALMRAEGYV